MKLVKLTEGATVDIIKGIFFFFFITFYYTEGCKPGKGPTSTNSDAAANRTVATA